jgi:hypothetical protein
MVLWAALINLRIRKVRRVVEDNESGRRAVDRARLELQHNP